MEANVFQGLALAGAACMGGTGGRVASANAVMRSARARRRMAEKERRAAARAFIERTGLKLPAALDGRAYDDADNIPLTAFLTVNPEAWTLIDTFCEIDTEWRINRS